MDNNILKKLKKSYNNMLRKFSVMSTMEKVHIYRKTSLSSLAEKFLCFLLEILSEFVRIFAAFSERRQSNSKKFRKKSIWIQNNSEKS